MITRDQGRGGTETYWGAGAHASDGDGVITHSLAPRRAPCFPGRFVQVLDVDKHA